MNTTKIPSNPLQKIALSLSGGGYRAASFHLGAMCYLNHLQYRGKPVLENVKLISTVSGGSITGVVYALKKQEGWSFEQIYEFILDRLQTLDLVKAGLQKLNPDGRWNNPFKRKNLINAFAELYDEVFTGGATFSVFNGMTSHLEAVVFNSSEFNNGINFRFRNKGTGFFGNFKLRVPQRMADEVKIADAIAASSCFPGGFEPLLWPHDFVHEDATTLKAYAKEAKPVGLMDGGIYDNQGIESILHYKSNGDAPYFDLVIVSDVASPYMKPFLPFADQPKLGLRKLTLNDVKNKVRRIATRVSVTLLAAALVLGALPLINGYANNIFTGLCLGLAIAFIALFFLQRYGQSKVKALARKGMDGLKQKIPPFYGEKLSHLEIGQLSLRRLESLLFDRINSLVTLLGDVFLKVIRRLNYNKLYEDKAYHFRRVSSLIRDLTENGPVTENRTKDPDDRRNEIGPMISEVVETAASFGTTLWFTEETQLDRMLEKLIASGQITLCYNLLRYLESLLFQKDNGFEELDRETKAALQQLYEQCLQDWERFKENPFFMSARM